MLVKRLHYRRPLVICALTLEFFTIRISVRLSDRSHWAREESVGDFWSELSFVSCTTSHAGPLFFSRINGAWLYKGLNDSQTQPNSDLARGDRALDWWFRGCEFKPQWGQFLTKFILCCVTSDLSDNLTEIRQISLSWKTRLTSRTVCFYRCIWWTVILRTLCVTAWSHHWTGNWCFGDRLFSKEEDFLSFPFKFRWRKWHFKEWSFWKSKALVKGIRVEIRFDKLSFWSWPSQSGLM